MRIILLGIDGADLLPLSKLDLPNIASLGKVHIMKSTIPPFSPIAWNSLFTGVEAKYHGVYGFIQPKQYSYDYEIVSSRTRKVKALWNYYPGIFYKIPFTYPPEPVNGILIPGLGSPYDGYKENKYDLKSRRFINHAINVLKQEIKDLKSYWHKDWKIFSCVFRITDIFQHYHWKDYTVLGKAYKRIDDFIGWVLKNKNKDDIIMIVSDHGFCGASQCFCINTWLAKEGYLFLPPAKDTFKSRLAMWVKNSRLRNIAINLLSKPFFSKMIKHVPIAGFDLVKNIDERTTAFYVPGSCCSITLNMKGRQPRGRLMKYDKERDNLMKKLKALPMIKEVYKTEGDLYDIVFTMEEGWTFRSHDTDNKIIKPLDTGVNGTHTEDGIFISNLDEPIKSIYDVAPKIRELLGEDITYYAPIPDTPEVLWES